MAFEDWSTKRFPSKIKVGDNTAPNSTVDINGSFGTDIKSVSSSYTATSEDHTILVDALNGEISISLPSATDQQRTIYNVKKIDNTSNNVRISTLNNDDIDGDTEQIITNQYDSIPLHSDGDQYWIL